MKVALLSRTVVLLIWLAALLWQGDRTASTAVLAVSLVAVWAAPLLRDALRARPVGQRARAAGSSTA